MGKRFPQSEKKYFLGCWAHKLVIKSMPNNASCRRASAMICLRPLQVDNIYVFIRHVAPVPAYWLFKTSAMRQTDRRQTKTSLNAIALCGRRHTDGNAPCSRDFFLCRVAKKRVICYFFRPEYYHLLSVCRYI